MCISTYMYMYNGGTPIKFADCAEEKSISVKVEELKEKAVSTEKKLSSLNETLAVLNKELAAIRQERETSERQHGRHGCVPLTLLCIYIIITKLWYM